MRGEAEERYERGTLWKVKISWGSSD